MPKYILIKASNKSQKPWLAHDWGNDLTKLKTKAIIDLDKIRHFDSSLFDKKMIDLKMKVLTTGEETLCRIIQLYSPGFRITFGKKYKKKTKAKKAAKKRK